LAVWPVFIVGDDPEKLTFKVAVDDVSAIGSEWESETHKPGVLDPGDEARSER
jgi:hypothetical protein